MTSAPVEIIDQIRAASRQMVREWGFMQATLASTDYPASAVHALLEIGTHRTLTAAQLGNLLSLEKSSVSRLLRKLIDAEELEEVPSDADGRVKLLRLSAKGQRTKAAIERVGRNQVKAALSALPHEQWDGVCQGLSLYANALKRCCSEHEEDLPDAIIVESGYRPGAIGRITQMHANFYSRHVGFGAYFEAKVASALAEFSARPEIPDSRMWLALQGERIVGSIAIDSTDLGQGHAHLRWFIVDEGIKGMGIGRHLLNTALAFCDARQFDQTHLWTFRGLDAARRLYEQAGFKLVDEKPGTQWGKPVQEQQFVRTKNAAGR